MFKILDKVTVNEMHRVYLVNDVEDLSVRGNGRN